MTRTHRRKIARSVAIRRVKPNAKRKERKTQKRKSRNIVMKGGVHENWKVYVIHQRLEQPKCFIVQQNSVMKDTIYLFFDLHMGSDEIKDFVYAAMGLTESVVISPDLTFPVGDKAVWNQDRPRTADEMQYIQFNESFVKLSRSITSRGYSLSIGKLYYRFNQVNRKALNHDNALTHYTTDPTSSMKNGQAIIDGLRRKTEKTSDYAFTEVRDESIFQNTDFWLSDIRNLLVKVRSDIQAEILTFCRGEPISTNINELKPMVAKQTEINQIMSDSVHKRVRGMMKGQMQEKIQKCKEIAKELNIARANELIDLINKDELIHKCSTFLIDRNVEEYISGKKKFTHENDIDREFQLAYRSAMSEAGFASYD